MWLQLVASANPAIQIATEANAKVNQISLPIIALGVALLGLSVTIVVIAYLNSRVPRDP